MAEINAVARLRGAMRDVAPGQPCPFGLQGVARRPLSLLDPMEEPLTRDPHQERRG